MGPPTTVILPLTTEVFHAVGLIPGTCVGLPNQSPSKHVVIQYNEEDNTVYFENAQGVRFTTWKAYLDSIRKFSPGLYTTLEVYFDKGRWTKPLTMYANRLRNILAERDGNTLMHRIAIRPWKCRHRGFFSDEFDHQASEDWTTDDPLPESVTRAQQVVTYYRFPDSWAEDVCFGFGREKDAPWKVQRWFVNYVDWLYSPTKP